jgi:hypothetical protein
MDDIAKNMMPDMKGKFIDKSNNEQISSILPTH